MADSALFEVARCSRVRDCLVESCAQTRLTCISSHASAHSYSRDSISTGISVSWDVGATRCCGF